MIDAYASRSWYAAHLIPTWLALPPGERGRFHVDPRIRSHVAAQGVPTSELRSGRPSLRSRLPVLVASHSDLRMCRPRPIVLAQHGAGQSYVGSDHPAYAGGRDNGAVVLFLCPSESTAARWRAAYPSTPAEVVGCPKLDGVTARSRGLSRVDAADNPLTNAPHSALTSGYAEYAHTYADQKPRGLSRGRAVIALSWHWDFHLLPEGRSAFPHYAEALARLANGPWKLLGHAHPRAWRAMRPWYEAHGIEPVERFEDVVARADLLAVDNSSVLYEFAALGRPVVVLNAPWYRRDVEHGLRFWSAADVGLQVDEPGDLADTIETALVDPPAVAARRDRVVTEVYTYLDGRSAQRAAQAIVEVTQSTPRLRGSPG